MNNKVAILSWYNYDNYGTVLQAYALEQAINKLGFEAHHIDYTPYKRFNISYDENIIKDSIAKVKQKIKNRYVKDEQRIGKFVDFRRNYLKLTDKCFIQSDFDKLNENFSIFVTGSDQIWSPYFFDDRYYLDFVRENKKKVAYAPSLGVESIPYDYLKAKYHDYLIKFDYLSVREKQGATILSDILNHNVNVVLDPVFLLSQEEWGRLISNKKSEDYILAYFLGNNKDNIKKAERYAKTCKKDLKVIPIFRNGNLSNFEVGVGPIEFLSLIKGAYAILTDSFHGVAFSIIFKKSFLVFERFNKYNKKSQNSRIYNILELLDLESRLVHNDIDIDLETTIDFDKVGSLLEIQQEKSIDFLTQALNGPKTIPTTRKFYITKNCCGCGACSVLCPKSAISMRIDGQGFISANIDFEKCVHCQKCVNICPMNDREQNWGIINHNTKLFSYVSRSDNVLKHSSSGGVSYDIAIDSLQNGRSCLGAVYDYDNNVVLHEVINRKSQVSKIQGSKYIQSNFINGFSCFLNSCDAGVVFGTPCQIAAARQVMKSEKINKDVVLVDLICHGVPSKLLWDKYLSYVMGEKQTKCQNILFRDKTKGWSNKYIRIESSNYEYTRKSSKDMFYHFFDTCSCNMPSCFECPFREKSCADLRIGDFWGDLYKNNKKGVNECLVITDKGLGLLSHLDGLCEEHSIDNYFKYQQVLNYTKPAYYACLLDDLKNENLSLEVIDNKYNRNRSLKESLSVIYRHLKRFIK